MAMRDLVAEIDSRATKMNRAERVRRIRELVAESRENKTFIQEFFPHLYLEAFPSASKSSASGPKGSGSSPLQSAGR